jgi:hypothetical protein
VTAIFPEREDVVLASDAFRQESERGRLGFLEVRVAKTERGGERSRKLRKRYAEDPGGDLPRVEERRIIRNYKSFGACDTGALCCC